MQKKSHKAEITCTKKFCGQGRESSPRRSTGRPQKNPQKIRSRRSYINVAVSGSQHINLIKSVTSLVLKKKSHYYSLRFSTKSAD